jgi:hypothetical protein
MATGWSASSMPRPTLRLECWRVHALHEDAELPKPMTAAIDREIRDLAQ